jgi:hypothetical protein
MSKIKKNSYVPFELQFKTTSQSSGSQGNPYGGISSLPFPWVDLPLTPMWSSLLLIPIPATNIANR